MRNPRQEAFERLAGRYEVRVLEPSPPAVNEEPWFADDPTARDHVPAARELISPVSSGDLLWDDLARDNADLSAWCAERWLGAYRRLKAPPASLPATRLALHRVAEHVLTPARQQANGKIALRYVTGGFGTPFFGDDVQIRVDGAELVVDSPGGERRAPISSLGAAAAHAGVALEIEDEPLDVDEAASRFLGDWYGFTASVLEQLRAEAAPELEASRVQLWTEHFDLATELGAKDTGARAGYGGSPGDELHPEPYLYVVPWEASRAQGKGWDAGAFAGAELSYADLLAAPDQRATALEFFRGRLQALTG
jgi:hypothetical protein